MKFIIIFLVLITTMQSTFIFNFTKTADATLWKTIDDVVMGGRSSGKFYIRKEGIGVFTGRVSLENNGGFSSLRYRFNSMSTKSYSKIILKVKGDGKAYQFRIKNNVSDYFSYIASFTTSKEWETIEIQLADMYPAFRGRKLNISNYNSDSIEEVAFLIGNKKAEDFMLEIDSIVLK